MQNGINSSIKSILNGEKYYVPLINLLSDMTRFSFQIMGEADIELVGTEIDSAALIKLMGAHYENSYGDLLENICRYIHIFSKFTKSCIFAFVNLKTFLNDEQMEQLIRYALYEKIHLFLIDSSPHNNARYVREIIIDCDLCEIHSFDQ